MRSVLVSGPPEQSLVTAPQSSADTLPPSCRRLQAADLPRLLADPLRAEIAAAFKKADKDSDGTLDKEEAKAMPHVAKNFDAIEPNLRRDWERSEHNAGLSWDRAKEATRDAWHRVERTLPGDADHDGR